MKGLMMSLGTLAVSSVLSMFMGEEKKKTGDAAANGDFAALLAQLGVGGGQSVGGGSAVAGDSTSDAVREVLIGQQAIVPMGMEDKGHTSDMEKEAMEILGDMTENGLNSYWKWVMKNLREQVMEEMGISEDALAAMSPTERATVEAAIADEVQKRLEEAMAAAKKEGKMAFGVEDVGNDPAARMKAMDVVEMAENKASDGDAEKAGALM